jgi:hypothetical protein
MIAAAETRDERIATDVAKRAADLTTDDPIDPIETAHQLRASTHGCKWMISQWHGLIEKLKQAPGRVFEPNERRLGLYLLGKDPIQIFTDGVVTAWDAAYIAALLGHATIDPGQVFEILAYDRPPNMDDAIFGRQVLALIAGLPDPAEGIARMVATATAAIAELTERLGFLEAQAERDRLIAINKARFEESKEAALRLRYTTANKKMMDGAIATLNALKAQRLAEARAAEAAAAAAAAAPPAADPDPDPDPDPEPGAAVPADAVPPGTSEPVGPTATNAPSREQGSPNVTAAGGSAAEPSDGRSP